MSLIQQNQTLVFQGDSITDAGRDREAQDLPNQWNQLGHGFAHFASATLLARYGGALNCFNRGIAGNKVPDLLVRWEQDCLALKPDLLSILIGVNDFWRTVDGDYRGTIETYRDQFEELLTQTRAARPGIKLVIGEPFLIREGAVTEDWQVSFKPRQRVARDLADRFDATWVPFQSVFDQACRRSPASTWVLDGIHPTPAGYALMTDAWLDAVSEPGGWLVPSLSGAS